MLFKKTLTKCTCLRKILLFLFHTLIPQSQSTSELFFTLKWLKWTEFIQLLLNLDSHEMFFNIWALFSASFSLVIHVFYSTMSEIKEGESVIYKKTVFAIQQRKLHISLFLHLMFLLICISLMFRK